MEILKKISERRDRKKQERYEKNKLAKIAHFSQKYGIKKANRRAFDTRSQADRYLETLKHKILTEQLSMLGEYKLDTLRYCLEDCLKNDVAGDIIETGVWKGGATIYLAGILKAHGNTDKKVLVADSFAGLPPPDEQKWPLDKGDTHHTRDDLAVGLEEVKANFQKFDLLGDNVEFIKGFFEESLQSANIERLSILRLDGDMYGSTMTVLEQLYLKLAQGGYLILDDWLLTGARQALLDFRASRGIAEEMYEDFSGVYWKKTAG